MNRLFNDMEYEIIKTLSERERKGTYIIKHLKSNKKYILKIKENNNNDKNIYNILKNVNCKNIVKLISFVNKKEEEYYYCIYEYIEGCNLLEYINKNKELSEEDLKNIFIQIVDGLDVLHNNCILHCDLKLENIIVNKDKLIKIIDFDLSIVCDNCDGFITNSIFGTLQYIAPESYDLCIYSKKTDIWQLGIILYILITNKYPHDNTLSQVNSYSNLCRINLFKHINLDISKESIIKKNYNPNLYNLLKKLLEFDEKNRFNINQIKNSSWLN